MKTNLTVALVDDDAGLCKAVSRLLCAAGIQSTSYSSAEAFLADEERANPDCLVLDIQLPGMSGFDLRKHLAARGTSLPIVFITAYDEAEAREEALKSGCVAYLRKTDPGRAVIEAIQQALSMARCSPAQVNRSAATHLPGA